MDFGVFYAWQSDTDQEVNRYFIRDALKRAIKGLRADAAIEESPRLDHDTKGVPGTPDIFTTILEKISASGIFVADVTPVATTPGGKYVANPNVILELGYALARLGDRRILLVLNEWFCGPEHLPFDLSRRRWPITYKMEPGHEPSSADEKQLSDKLRDALRLVIESGSVLSVDEEARRRGEPVRRAIVVQLAKTFSSLFNVSHHNMRRLYETDPFDPRNAAQLGLRQAGGRVARLREMADLSAGVLQPDLMPDVLHFLHNSEEVIRKLQFFAEIYAPEREKCDFVGSGPFAELRELESVAGRLRTHYPEVFSSGDNVLQGLPTCAGIDAVWAKASKSTGRIFHDAENYKNSPGRTPYVLDINHLRKLTTRELRDGVMVLVYDES